MPQMHSVSWTFKLDLLYMCLSFRNDRTKRYDDIVLTKTILQWTILYENPVRSTIHLHHQRTYSVENNLLCLGYFLKYLFWHKVLVIRFYAFSFFSENIISIQVDSILVTAQPHPQPTPTQQKVGWDTIFTKKPPTPPHPTHHKLILNKLMLK